MTSAPTAFFTSDGAALVPRSVARSLWNENQMHGVAVSSALARATEHAVADLGRLDELRPSRYTVDLFRPATMDPFVVSTEVVREGPRICLVDAIVVQNQRPVARSSTIFLKPTAAPEGEVWSADHHFSPPSLDLAPPSDEAYPPYFFSEGLGWSQNFFEHQNASRHMAWQRIPRVVAEEELTTFVAVAGVGDSTSLVTNWGTNGVEFINTDINLTLSRLPDSPEVGLAAMDHLSEDGISVGTAAVFDRRGPIGLAVVTALANSRRAVDFQAVAFDDEGPKPA
jgi:Thioesterase-like superfamily